MGRRLVEAASAVILPQIHLEPVVRQCLDPIQLLIHLVLGAHLLPVPIQPQIHSAPMVAVPSLVPQPHLHLLSVVLHWVAIVARPRALEAHQVSEVV